VRRTKLFDRSDDEFLNEVGAVGNAGDESCARNPNSTKWQLRTDRANKKRGHADGDQGKLPDAGNNGEVFRFAEV